MQPTFQIDLSERLQTRMDELMAEITQIEQYLGRPVICDNKPQLPLGVMGQIMASELHSETQQMAERSHYLEENIDSWEKTKASMYLHKKIALLITLAGIIAQLPALNAQTQIEASHFSQRVIEQCEKIDVVLNAFVSETIIVSQPQLSGA